jgi:hypothetical protein
LAFLALLVFPAPLSAALSNVKVILRIGPAVPPQESCLPENSGVEVNCQSLFDDAFYDLDAGPGSVRYYLLVAEAPEGVGGLSLGIRYGGGLFVTFTSCTDGLEFTNNGWPSSGGGTRITWTSCPAPAGLQAQTVNGIQVCFGSFYVYKYGVSTVFQITKNPLGPGPEDDELVVGNCSAVEFPLPTFYAGMIGIGDCPGYLPCWHHSAPPGDCTPTPVTPVTWGQVKTRYEGRP